MFEENPASPLRAAAAAQAHGDGGQLGRKTGRGFYSTTANSPTKTRAGGSQD